MFSGMVSAGEETIFMAAFASIRGGARGHPLREQVFEPGGRFFTLPNPTASC
jgi:hypothetical protein